MACGKPRCECKEKAKPKPPRCVYCQWEAYIGRIGIRAGVQPIGSGPYPAPGSYFGVSPYFRVAHGYFGPSRFQASPHHRKALLPGYFGGDGLALLCARMRECGPCASADARRAMCDAAGFGR